MADAHEPPASQPETPAPRPRAAPPKGMVRAYLEATAGPEKGQRFRLAPGVSVLGRDASCEVTLGEPAVSRQHARIERRGEEWLLINLSSNGTVVNKQPVDAVPLSDGDEIRLGAKTRLRFALEQVSISPSGRPQFRARTGRPGDEERVSVEESAGEEAEEEEGGESLFARRKKLFIALGGYFAVILIGGLFLYIYSLTGDGPGGGLSTDIMGLEDQVAFADGRRLRITGTAANGAVWVEDNLGQQRVVTLEEMRAGGVRRVPGMRRAIEEFPEAERKEIFPNAARGDQYKRLALSFYDQRNLHEANLFKAVRAFQRALAYYGGQGYFEEPVIDNIYREAMAELVREIHRVYKDAILREKTGDLRAAADLYREVLARIPDRDNPIVRNVTRRLRALPAKARDPEA